MTRQVPLFAMNLNPFILGQFECFSASTLDRPSCKPQLSSNLMSSHRSSNTAPENASNSAINRSVQVTAQPLRYALHVISLSSVASLSDGHLVQITTRLSLATNYTTEDFARLLRRIPGKVDIADGRLDAEMARQASDDSRWNSRAAGEVVPQVIKPPPQSPSGHGLQSSVWTD